MKTLTLLLLLITMCLGCVSTEETKKLTLMEEAEMLDRRIGGQRDLIKSLYESEIAQLKLENKQLKAAIIRKDSIIDKCVELSIMVTEHFGQNNK